MPFYLLVANLHVTLTSGVGTFGTLTSLPGMRGTLGTDGLGTGTFGTGTSGTSGVGTSIGITERRKCK